VAIMRGGARDTASALTMRASVPPAGTATGDYVAAMSRALGLGADQIAAELRR
jgi:hypothetical protein